MNSNCPTTSRADQLGTSCTKYFLMCYLMTLSVDDSISDRRVNECGLWWNDTDGRTAVPGENPVSLQLFPPWIPIGLPWDWTWAYTVINHLNHDMGPVQEISTSDFCWNVCETSVPHVFKGINNNIQGTSWPFSNIPLKCCSCEHLN